MDISSRLDFGADPTTVSTMMTDKAWLEQLVARSEPLSSSVQVAGANTVVQFQVAAPAEVSRFVGSSLELRQSVEWSPAAADGSREGTLVVEVPGMPVRMDGHARLYPGGRGTIVDYTGTLKVNIPLVGRKVEQQAAPYVKQAIDEQQAAGDEWLAAHHA